MIFRVFLMISYSVCSSELHWPSNGRQLFAAVLLHSVPWLPFFDWGNLEFSRGIPFRMTRNKTTILSMDSLHMMEKSVKKKINWTMFCHFFVLQWIFLLASTISSIEVKQELICCRWIPLWLYIKSIHWNSFTPSFMMTLIDICERPLFVDVDTQLNSN